MRGNNLYWHITSAAAIKSQQDMLEFVLVITHKS